MTPLSRRPLDMLRDPALQQVHAALLALDLPALRAAAPLVDWAEFRDQEANLFSEPDRLSLLKLLSHLHGNHGPAGLRIRFARRALVVLGSAGYSALDDSYVTAVLGEEPALARVVAAHAAEKDERSALGKTLLHMVLECGAPSPEQLAAVLVSKVDVNAKTNFGKTALHLLWDDAHYAPYVDEEQVGLWEHAHLALLARGARENIADAEGRTVLGAMTIALDPDGPNAGGIARCAERIWSAREAFLRPREHQAALEAQVGEAPAGPARPPRI